MSNQTEDVKQLIQDLLRSSAREQLDAMQRFGSLVQRVSSRALNQEEIQEAYLEFAREESTRYLLDLTRLGIGFYESLLQLNSDYNERFFERFRAANNHRGAAAHDQQPTRHRVELSLAGVVGSDVTTSFVIENRREETADITFLVSEFVNVARQRDRFRPPVQLEPPRFSLRGGEERTVTLRIPLLEQMFAAGEGYRASILVRGHDELELIVTVWVEAPSPRAGVGAADEGKEIPVTYAEVAEPQTERAAESVAADDLSALKGVGPRYQQRLNDAGVRTFAALTRLDEEALQDIGGKRMALQARRYRWAEQASLAAAGQLSALQALQKRL